MRWITFLLISFIFFSCGMKQGEPISYSEKERISDEILYRVAVKLRDEKGLITCGTGGGMMNQIEMLALSFDYRKPVSIEEGRALLVNAVQTLLSEINANESIRPYLLNYPFEPTNVEIRIFLRNTDGSNFGKEELCALSATEGMLQYYIHSPNGRLEAIHDETYEKALLRGKGPPEARLN